MIRRFAFQWFTGGRKPSGREWARQLGIGHTWLQKLEFELIVQQPPRQASVIKALSG
jgi:hypothetical protein